MRPVVAFLILILALPALAGDGVLEINQTCAVQTGCFAGDTAGFPVTVTQPGSYVLTENLSIPPAAGPNAVHLSASEVTLDLNGFTITGTAQSGVGILIVADNVEVRNGNIHSFSIAARLTSRSSG